MTASFVDACEEVLRAHLALGDEGSLERAYDLGRRALADGMGIVDVVAAHAAASTRATAGMSAPEATAAGEKGAAVLRECLSPLEMAYKGYREANRTLVEKNETLRREEQRRQEMIAFIVHDLKNPLAALVADLEFAAGEGAPTPEAQDALADARDAAESILRMAMDLLDVGRSEEGTLPIHVEDVVVNDIAAHVAAAIARRSHQRRLKLVVDCAPDLHVPADPELLRRVLENLLDNCCKYAPPDSEVRIEGHFVEGDGVVIRVRDRGPGIPLEARAKIFEKYVRLDDAVTTKRMSRGLGLPFCRLAVERHGGSIGVDDNEAGGAVFWVRLPIPAR